MRESFNNNRILEENQDGFEYSWFWALMGGVLIGIAGFTCAICVAPRFKDKDGKFKKGVKGWL